jgi:hypothetical protein
MQVFMNRAVLAITLDALGFVLLYLIQQHEHVVVLVLLAFNLLRAMLVFMKLALLVQILGVPRVLLVLLQIPEPVLGQQCVLLVPLARIHYLRTLRRVRPVPPLLTQPLSNAPPAPIKPLQPVTQDTYIMEILVMPLVNCVVPVLSRILEQMPGQQHVPLVPPVCIRHHRTLHYVRPVVQDP